VAIQGTICVKSQITNSKNQIQKIQNPKKTIAITTKKNPQKGNAQKISVIGIAL
jgi:hypothetical protein